MFLNRKTWVQSFLLFLGFPLSCGHSDVANISDMHAGKPKKAPLAKPKISNLEPSFPFVWVTDTVVLNSSDLSRTCAFNSGDLLALKDYIRTENNQFYLLENIDWENSRVSSENLCNETELWIDKSQGNFSQAFHPSYFKVKSFLNSRLSMTGVVHSWGGKSRYYADCTGSIMWALDHSKVVSKYSIPTVYFEYDTKNFKRINCQTECLPGAIAARNGGRAHTWVIHSVANVQLRKQKNGQYVMGGSCTHPDNLMSDVASAVDGGAKALLYSGSLWYGKLSERPLLRNNTHVCVIPRAFLR